MTLWYATTVFSLTFINFIFEFKQFETVEQAIDLIASVSCLQNIKFWRVGCHENVCNYSSQAIVPPLKRIQFDADPLLDSIMNWICRCHPTPSVHTLVVSELADAPTLCNFIRYLGSALEDLTILCHRVGTVQSEHSRSTLLIQVQ